jgi:hypothetical protein
MNQEINREINRLINQNGVSHYFDSANCFCLTSLAQDVMDNDSISQWVAANGDDLVFDLVYDYYSVNSRLWVKRYQMQY